MAIRIRGINRLRRLLLKYRKKRLGLAEAKPNYAFLERFNPGDVAIDVGTCDDPDFSRLLISRYGIKCFGVDPTRKHAQALIDLAARESNFAYLPWCLGASEGTATFFESQVNDSGSLMTDHHNVVHDPIESYEVVVHTLDYVVAHVLKETGVADVSIVKLDIEGAEYELISSLTAESIRPIRQLLVEFHHDTVQQYSMSDTLKVIEHVKRLGMRSIIYNGRDCLFYWQRE